jgi:RraA family protein
MNGQAALMRREITRVAAGTVQEAARFAASILADVAGRRGTLDGRIASLVPGARMAGPAFTVEVRPGDNLMIHAALSLAKPGDVLVVDGKGDRSCALMGGLMIATCRKIGLAGVVVDGAMRDIDELRTLGMPVFAVCTNPNGPTKLVPGRINWPVSCGGVAFEPGDLVVGDDDGVVAIEREKAPTLLAAAARKVEDERRRLHDIEAGRIGQAWLEPALRAAGVLRDGEAL